jgi:chemotaxis protein methyltransferase CheR
MIDGLPNVREADYRFVADLIYERFGIQFGDKKKVLVAGRLAKRLRELGLDSFADYVRLLQSDKNGLELVELVNRLTTNHSFLFRERDHFDFLASQVIPPLLASARRKAGRPLRIWSAGCAAGEEAHTIAIVLRETLGADMALMDPAILATDISVEALKEGQAGVYPEARFRELPRPYIERYFRRLDAENWQALPSIHDMILFKRLNLMAMPYPFKKAFDVVFCRNVMIYFDAAARSTLVNALYKVLNPGGYLFIGHSETLQRGDSSFVYIKPAIYRREA